MHMSGRAAAEPDDFLDKMYALALHALRGWDLVVTNIEAIKVRENAVFRLDLATGGRAVLRVHRQGYHSDAELDSEFAWMQALDAADIPVPRVIRSRLGRNFEVVLSATVDGPRQVDVFEWIDGRQLGSIEAGLTAQGTAVDSQYYAIGAITARIHNQAVSWQCPIGFRRHAWDAAGLVGEQPFWGRFWELEALTKNQRELLTRTRTRIADELASHGTESEHYGLIHADLVPENVLVDGEDLRVIDFDDAGFGWHLFDLATSLYFITGEGIYPAARAALIRGYRSERELSEQVLQCLPLFLAARGTTYLGWLHTRQGSDAARELTPFLVERACAIAAEYLMRR
jgi:Ser/Thr protein kinase RdoA (MazF antagonist)